MCIIQVFDLFRQIFPYQLLHFFRKRAGVADRIAFLNTGGKNNRISSSFYKFARPKHRFFSGASAAIDKAHDFNVFIDALKGPFLFPYHFKINRSGAIILGLHTSDDSDFHQ